MLNTKMQLPLLVGYLLREENKKKKSGLRGASRGWLPLHRPAAIRLSVTCLVFNLLPSCLFRKLCSLSLPVTDEVLESFCGLLDWRVMSDHMQPEGV